MWHTKMDDCTETTLFFVSSLLDRSETVAPRARFELATLRLTAAALGFLTENDDLLSC